MTPAATHLVTLDGMAEIPACTSPPIALLTQRMAAGEEAAFEEFHAAWFPRLFRYVLVLLRGDDHAARDVTQETLLRVVRHVRRFEDEVIFWDWLARLARSAAADHGRRASRYRRVLEFLALCPPPEATGPAPDVVADAVARGLSEISAADRDLLSRKYTDAATVRDIAGAFTTTEEAIESRLARARRALREAVFRLLRHENS